jgi:pimeloyl-ACP methyl ester carboxylesterase
MHGAGRLWLVASVETEIRSGDVVLPATVTLPEGPVLGGIIPLHGAEAGQRSFFLYEHLSRVLPAMGVAVLRYDRRPAENEGDVPFSSQASDAMAAARVLREHVGDAPIGLWGFSQGAWAAPVAAATFPAEVKFLVLVSSCGVSPAQQMRIGCDKQLRQHGYSDADRAELAALRLAFEEYLRGDRDRASAQAVVDACAARAWFPLVYVPPVLPDAGVWADMDFDPEPVFAGVSCPVLAFYGETDAWMPIEESADAWHRAGEASGHADITVVRLVGCDHMPTLEERADHDGISPQYTQVMSTWLETHLGAT